MPVIAVVNPKGGVGKTTLATNIAGWLASLGTPVMLGDADRQASSRRWLERRPADAAPVRHWELDGSIARPPKGVTHVVLDTPAQISDKRLDKVLKLADSVVVPLAPSVFDMDATASFLERLLAEPKLARRLPDRVAIVGMRVDARTRSADALDRFLERLGLPVAARIRDTQTYVQLAAHGLSLFDVPEHRVAPDRETWRPLTNWLGRSRGGW